MKKGLFLFLLMLSISLTGCSLFKEETKATTPTPEVTATPEVLETESPTPTPEVTLDSIYVKNQLDNYYVDLGKQFDTSNLVIIAKYSNNTEIEVTENVSYSNINTTNNGDENLIISYQDVKTSIKIKVVKPIGLDVVIDNVKTLYKTGDKFDLSGLIVHNLYENNLKLPSSTFTVTLLDSSNDIVNNSNALKTGIYTVLITNNGFIYKYQIEAIDGDLSANKKINFNYSISELNSYTANVYTNYPEQYAKVPEGYVFLGYSKSFYEWKDGDNITIHVAQKQENKKYIAYMNEGYLYNTYKLYDSNSVINRNEIKVVPSIIPNASQLSHWDLPFTFIINENLFVTPIFCPSTIDLSALNINDDITINNVSANAIDVNVDEFLASTPEGYSLRSITLGLNGEVVYEIPYTEGMVSAYFTDLTNNTSYEVGAYYSQSQNFETVSKKSKQLTYDFHFVGFMIMTCGDIMYRVRMMYDGDCLYRWYFGPQTIVFTHNFFFSFALPNEYKNYKVAGSFDELGYLDQDKDCEVILVPPASNTCTVVFYDRLYPTYINILDLQVVNKGSNATPPTVEQYYFNYNGTYKYNLTGWSSAYTNVRNNVYTCPIYSKEALIPPKAYLTAYVGDDYLIANVSMSDYSTVSSTKLYLTRKSNNTKIFTESKTYISNTRFVKKNVLVPGENYALTLEYNYQLNDGNGVQNVKVVYDFTAMSTSSTLGYNFIQTDFSYDFFRVECDGNQYVDGYLAMPINNNNAKPLFGKEGYFYGAYQDTSYYVNYYKQSVDNDNIYFVYSDDYECGTRAPQMYYIQDAKYKITTKLEFKIKFSDYDRILNCFLVYIDSPETSYHGVIRFFPLEPNYYDSDGYACYEMSFQTTDPDSGETVTYQVDFEYLEILYFLDGTSDYIRMYPTTQVDSDGFTKLI